MENVVEEQKSFYAMKKIEQKKKQKIMHRLNDDFIGQSNSEGGQASISYIKHSIDQHHRKFICRLCVDKTKNRTNWQFQVDVYHLASVCQSVKLNLSCFIQ